MVETCFRLGDCCDFSGLAKDEKPIKNVKTGSIFCEVDTGKIYFFDKENSQWIEQFSFKE